MAHTAKIDKGFFYQRQIRCLSQDTQDLLAQKTIAIIGLGGLGSHILQTLGVYGFAKIILIDGDTVNLSNLHRQPLYTLADEGKSKALCAQNFLQKRAPFTEIEAHERYISVENISQMIGSVDVIIDAADQYKCSEILNAYSILKNIPLVLANVERQDAMVASFAGAEDTMPCYACLFPDFPNNVATCSNIGVDPRAVSLVAAHQANIVVEVLLNPKNTLGSLVKLNAGALRTSSLKILKDTECSVCSAPKTTIKEMLMIPEVKKVDNVPPGFTFIDVRNAEEFAQSPRDAINVPLDQLLESPEDLPKGDLVLCCVSGRRSLMAASFLKEIGREGEVYVLNQD